MNNLDCTKSILSAHRDARAWSDDAVAADLLSQLGLDPEADAENPKPAADPEEAEVALAEAHAKEAADKAAAARKKLDAKDPKEKGAKPSKQLDATTPASEKVALPPPSVPPVSPDSTIAPVAPAGTAGA